MIGLLAVLLLIAAVICFIVMLVAASEQLWIATAIFAVICAGIIAALLTVPVLVRAMESMN